MNKKKAGVVGLLVSSVILGAFHANINANAENTQVVVSENESADATAVVKQVALFFDGNRNGVQEIGEPAAIELPFLLFDANNQLIVQGKTDESGRILVNDLPSGAYQIHLSRPAGYIPLEGVFPWKTLENGQIAIDFVIKDEQASVPIAFAPASGSVVATYVDRKGNQLSPDEVLLATQPIDTAYNVSAQRRLEIKANDKVYRLVGLANKTPDGQLERTSEGHVVTSTDFTLEDGIVSGETRLTYVYDEDLVEKAKDKLGENKDGSSQSDKKDSDKKSDKDKSKDKSEEDKDKAETPRAATISDGTRLLVAQNPYVEHWSRDTAYEHDMFKQRYGITAEQLDGFIALLSSETESTRVTGEKLLNWQQISGIDARVLMAYAMQDSSLGFVESGSSEQPKLWKHGSDKPDATDEEHVVALAAFLRQEKNQSVKKQDEKYKANQENTLDSKKSGQLYFDDESAKVRVAFMEDIDRWIDEHGGTPSAPEIPASATVAGTSYTTIPEKYTLSKKIDTRNYLTQSYPWGQCTWYVYNRAAELGIEFDPYMGDGGQWQSKPGYEITNQPAVGHAISFSPGQAGASLTHGHVAIVEAIGEDGSILISESNAEGLGVISYRMFSAEEASQLTYVIGKR
ncbi:CHAP domain-containing protein [Streptococcus ovuberis]|uniref:CHAP domain-containing protein n=1 Tax=Streptococcus ovuberis TaxID=1936207 RepID=A0A7X6MX16_9STRE|nr:CHAP domain-containing protein [Streptococcus ovuberis]NKZ19950.1 CHAP domain-containing protein [Streptococcus ovuberis]